MTPTYWFILALVWAATLCLAGWAGWAACYQARDLDVLAAERDGLVKGTAKGQLEGYNGGFTAGWRAAHRLALSELTTYPTSRGGKRIVKALAAMVPPTHEEATKHTQSAVGVVPNPSWLPSLPDGRRWRTVQMQRDAEGVFRIPDGTFPPSTPGGAP